MSDYEKYVLAERRTGAEDMRERAANLARTFKPNIDPYRGSFVWQAQEQIADALLALPIDEGGE
jgi:hypothetical protein